MTKPLKMLAIVWAVLLGGVTITLTTCARLPGNQNAALKDRGPTTSPASGWKLDSSIGAEYSVMGSTKTGIVSPGTFGLSDPATNPATAPTTQP